MPSAWLCIPSARPPAEANAVLEKWRAQGYKIALWRDSPSPVMDCDLAIVGGWIVHRDINPKWPSVACTSYPGYARSVNDLIAAAMGIDPEFEWAIAGGDDTEPDPNHTADEIAAQLTTHFGGTFGVCQPTGDRFAGGQIDRICGSPWLGREWCKRINQGRGPLWPEYRHMFVDEECQAVALKYGVLRQRPDLIHLHKHFMRESDAIDSRAVAEQTPQGNRYGGAKVPRPAFLDEANSREHWMKYEKLFKDRRDAVPSFPGSEPL